MDDDNQQTKQTQELLQRSQLVLRLWTNYGKSMPKDIVSLWVRLTMDIPVQDLQTTIDNLICSSKWCPTIADIRAVAKPKKRKLDLRWQGIPGTEEYKKYLHYRDARRLN